MSAQEEGRIGIHPKNGVSVQTVLDYADQERTRYKDIGADFSNRGVMRLIQQQQLGFAEKPVLTGASEITAGDEPKLTIDSDQLKALEILFAVDYLLVSAKPAGTFRALIRRTTGNKQDAIEVPVEYRIKPPDNNHPFIISQGLSERLGLSEKNEGITIEDIHHTMFSRPNIKQH